MLKELDITPEDSDELLAVNRLLANEVKSQALSIEKLKHQLGGQNRHRFGVRSESLDQLNLTFEEDQAIAEVAKELAKPALPSAEDKAPRQHSRKPLPDHLERRDKVLSPGENCTRCVGKLKIRRIAELCAVEKEARVKTPEARVALRQARATPVFDFLVAWLHAQLPKISGKSPLAQAIRCALVRMPKARSYLENCRLELDNNTAGRTVKPVAIGRQNWMFAGSEGGGKAMAIAFTLIETAKLDNVNPQACLTWVLARIADHKITRLDELLPWRYAAQPTQQMPQRKSSAFSTFCSCVFWAFAASFIWIVAKLYIAVWKLSGQRGLNQSLWVDLSVIMSPIGSLICLWMRIRPTSRRKMDLDR